jgi:hypothetical protein
MYNLYTVRYVYVYTHSSQYGDTGRTKEIKKIGTSVNAVCQRNPPMCHFEHACHRFASPGVSYLDEF